MVFFLIFTPSPHTILRFIQLCDLMHVCLLILEYIGLTTEHQMLSEIAFISFCIVTLYDWSGKLAPLSQPIRSKIKTNNSSFQNYTHPDDHTTRTNYVTVSSNRVGASGDVGREWGMRLLSGDMRIFNSVSWENLPRKSKISAECLWP